MRYLKIVEKSGYQALRESMTLIVFSTNASLLKAVSSLQTTGVTKRITEPPSPFALASQLGFVTSLSMGNTTSELRVKRRPQLVWLLSLGKMRRSD